MTGYKIFFKSVKYGFVADKKDFLLSLFTTVVSSSWVFISTASFALIINEVSSVISTGFLNQAKINQAIILLVLSNFLPTVSDFLDRYIGAKLFRKINLFFKTSWLKKIGDLDLEIIESKNFQDLNQKVNERSIGSLQSLVSWFFVNFGNIIRLVTASIIFLSFDFRLTILAVISVLPAFFIEKNLAKSTFALWDTQVESRRNVGWKTSHFLNPRLITELKLLGKTSFYSDKIYNFQKRFNDDADKLDYKAFKLKFLGEIVFIVCFVFSMYLIIQMAISGEIGVGTMLFVYTSFNAFQFAAGNILRSLGRIREHIKFSEGYYELMELKSVINENEGEGFDYKKAEDIKLSNVNFKYPDTDVFVLKNINLEIKKYDRIAIVGENGASKTTLTKLISKMYLPTSGEIMIGDKNIKEIKTTDWQRSLSIMTQDYAVYSDSISDQIAYGAQGDPKSVSKTKIKEAARRAHALEFIEKLPKNFESVPVRAFTNGVELSRGQNQKVALARFLLRDSKVLILDEPTSAIDAIAESKIFNELFEEERDRTIIIISHRFNTVKRADRIIVLDHGEIVEEGSHDELVKKNGKYHEMYMAQAKEYQE
jgi:ATP-binding cassette subfamily B protein